MPELGEDEVGDVIGCLANGKATGPDAIPNEIIKYGGPKVKKMIH